MYNSHLVQRRIHLHKNSLDNKERIKVSIIMPTAGTHKYIFEAIKHVIENTTLNYELIVAYNGVKEKKVFIEALTNCPRVKVLVSKVAHSVSHAINEGIDQAKGEYLVVLDDDVYIHERGWLQKLIKVFNENQNIGLLGGAEAKGIDRNLDDLGYLDTKKEVKICDWAPTIMLTKKPIVQEGCMIDEFYSLGHYDVDWHTTIRSKGYIIAVYKIKHRHIGGATCNYLFHRDSKTMKEWLNESKRVLYFLEKHKDVLDKNYYERTKDRYRIIGKKSTPLFLLNSVIYYYKMRLTRFLRK